METMEEKQEAKSLNELEKRPKIGIITGWDEKLNLKKGS
jgi:hypothetical protein